MLRALDEEPGRYDLSSLAGITSSGAMFTEEVKDGLIRHMPALVITDSFASTEAMGMGVSMASKDGHVQDRRFPAQRIRHRHRRERPAGRRRARHPAWSRSADRSRFGYYKDEAKTAQDVPHHRRQALRRARRFRARGAGRHGHAARPRQQLHQHRGREGVSGRGRGGAEDASLRRGRAGARRAGREMGPGGDRRGGAVARRQLRRGRSAHPCAQPARRLQDAQADSGRGRQPSRPQRQGRLQERRRVRAQRARPH